MTRFERWAVWTTSLATAVTGVVYLWMKYALTPANEWDVVNHPLQPLVLKLHILVAPLLVFAVGLVTMRHVWRHFVSKTALGRRSGVTTAAVLAPMVFTGYLIQAITHEGWLRAMVWGHVATGAIYVVGLALHQAMVRRRRGPGYASGGAAPRPMRSRAGQRVAG